MCLHANLTQGSCCNQSHKKRENSLETRAIFLIFSLELTFFGVKHREYIKIAKMAACSEDFFCGDDSDAFLAIFCSYGYGANEAV